MIKVRIFDSENHFLGVNSFDDLGGDLLLVNHGDNSSMIRIAFYYSDDEDDSLSYSNKNSDLPSNDNFDKE